MRKLVVGTFRTQREHLAADERRARVRHSRCLLVLSLFAVLAIAASCTRPSAQQAPPPAETPHSAQPPATSAPPASSTSAPPTASPPKASQTSAPVLQRFTLWSESRELAFFGFIPKGWTARGEVARPYLDGYFQFEARADPEGVKMFFFSAPAPLLFMEPNAMLQWYGNTQGTWYTLPSTPFRFYVWRYLSAREYIQSFLLSSLQQQFADAQIETILDRPDLSRIYQVYISSEESDGADAVITYRMGEVKMKAGYTVITRRYSVRGMGVDVSLWGAYLMGARAPESEFDQVQSLYSTFMPTFRVNPTWLRLEIEAQQQRQQMIDASLQRIRDMNYKMWTEQSQSMARVGRGWTNVLGATEDLRNPTTGEEFTLPVTPDANFFWQKGLDFVATKLDERPDIGFTRLQVVR